MKFNITLLYRLGAQLLNFIINFIRWIPQMQKLYQKIIILNLMDSQFRPELQQSRVQWTMNLDLCPKIGSVWSCEAKHTAILCAPAQPTPHTQKSVLVGVSCNSRSELRIRIDPSSQMRRWVSLERLHNTLLRRNSSEIHFEGTAAKSH